MRKRISITLLLAAMMSLLCTAFSQNFDKEKFFDRESWQSKGDIPARYNDGIYFDDLDFENDTFEIFSNFDLKEEGFYNITLFGHKDDLMSTGVVYAKGTDYSECSAAVPHLPYSNRNYNIYLRGVGTKDGKITIGFKGIGGKGIFVNDIKVERAKGPYELLQGGDITMLHYVLDNGGDYKDEFGNLLYRPSDTRHAKSMAVLKYLASRGFNVVRIRESVNPGRKSTSADGKYYLPDGYQDRTDCHELAQEAKEAGLKIQYTLNLSDYWSNGESQIVPKAWQENLKSYYSFDEKVDALRLIVRDYVTSTLSELKGKGVVPEYVSVGNETNGGFLYPYAYSYDIESSFASAERPVGKAHPENIALFVNAAYDAIKRVNPDTKVMVHIADNTSDVTKWGSPTTCKWYFDLLLKYGTKFDVIGLSYYPSWSEATCREFGEFAKQVIDLYGKDIFIMESGYNFTPKRVDGYDGQLSNNAPLYAQYYTFESYGQKAFVTELLNTCKGVGLSTERGEVVGSLYWDPLMIHVEDNNGSNVTGWAHFTSTGKADVNVVENTSLFDFDGAALEALEAYEANRYSVYSPAPKEETNTAKLVCVKAANIDWDKAEVYSLCGKLVKEFVKGEIYIIDGIKYRY